MKIKNREKLSDYPQVSVMLYQLLEPAIAAGLTEKHAEAIYTRLMGRYAKLHGEAFGPLRDKVCGILNMPDSEFQGPKRQKRK